MEQILYLSIGAALALAGGILTQTVQKYVDIKKEDEGLLYQALFLLAQYDEKTGVSLGVDLETIALKIRSRKFRNLAVELFRFVEDEKFKTENGVLNLMGKLHETINKPLSSQLQKRRQKRG